MCKISPKCVRITVKTGDTYWCGANINPSFSLAVWSQHSGQPAAPLSDILALSILWLSKLSVGPTASVISLIASMTTNHNQDVESMLCIYNTKHFFFSGEDLTCVMGCFEWLLLCLIIMKCQRWACNWVFDGIVWWWLVSKSVCICRSHFWP